MKALEFETSKGKFKLIDIPETIRVNNWNGTFVIDEENQIPTEKIAKGFFLNNVTEEQASEIVEDTNNIQPWTYKYYGYADQICFTAIESLHSLLKSKGIHLFENPYTKSTDLNSSFFSMQVDFNKEKEAEQKTFYNPYIFKL